ncbi:4Fe-4S binding protein [Labilibacter sediminis]|nr:4Fe-4S binding protein [Labilibacter sediminis]
MRKLLSIGVLSVIMLSVSGVALGQNDEFDSFDEFEQIDKSEGEFPEFEETDEFGELNQTEISAESGCSQFCANAEGCSGSSGKSTLWVLGILAATVLTGFLVRFKSLKMLRGVTLVVALVILGFYKGGCPCPIMSFQHSVLFVLGESVEWQKMLWFLGLIPITYLLGRVWCGWVCHLGALQEFIFIPGRVKILQSEKAQRVMRYIRIILLVTLVAQVVLTRTNLFKIIDPFKVAFNLYSSNITAWILLGLLLLSSVFIYRPFCKTVCPVGLILGWVSKIPGASVIGLKDKCTGCVSCNNSCKIRAITRDKKFSQLDNQECIACGECIQNCNKESLNFFRKNKQHEDKILCKRA